MARNYDAYLATYGDVYGDMSDGVKRAETIAMLRKRDARVAASARRELWRECQRRTTEDLAEAIRVKRIFLEIPEMAVRRYGDGAFFNRNLFNVDTWYLRMWRTEMRRRNGDKYRRH